MIMPLNFLVSLIKNTPQPTVVVGHCPATTPLPLVAACHRLVNIPPQLPILIGLVVALTFLPACIPSDTPVPPAPIVAASATATPRPSPTLLLFTSTSTRTSTPTVTSTPIPTATATVFAFSQQGDRLPTRAPTASPSPTQTATPALTRLPAPTATSTPILPPSPTPTSALSLNYWRGEYYDNPSLAGTPVLVRNDPNLDFNWILDSPAPGIPADNFTVRWSRQFDFIEDGDYRFFADADDGVKVYVDGWSVIDEWNTDEPQVHSGVFADIKRGIHTVTVEYFESGGYARIKVWAEKTTIVEDNWLGEYYNNPDLRDPAALVRQDGNIDFDWGQGSPVAGLEGNDFSVRWRRTLYFLSGDYRFQAEIANNDAVRIYVDGWLVTEGRKEDGGTVTGIFERLGAGLHTLTVEYQEFTGQARIKFSWEKL